MILLVSIKCPFCCLQGCSQCDFGPFLVLNFAVQFSQNHNCITPYFYDHICGAVQYSLEFSQNHNRTAPHFCSHMYGAVYKMQFERFKVGIFFKFWAFLTQPKTAFFLYFGPSVKLLSQFFFILDQLSQSTLARVIKLGFFFFFFLKTRVIILLIIYLILKINKYTNIQGGSSAVRFVWFVQFSYYKTANCSTPCCVMYYYLRCGVVMLFRKRFWYGFCNLYGLCGLVNTPTCNLSSFKI